MNSRHPHWPALLSLLAFTMAACSPAIQAQPPENVLEAALLSESSEELGRQAVSTGNARRGAMLFYRQQLACARCHSTSDEASPLGPNLSQPVAAPDPPLTPARIVESLLLPSKRIRTGFQPSVLLLSDGRQVRGIIAQETDDTLHLKDISREGAVVQIHKDDIEARKLDDVSLMPEQLASQLQNRQQFLDLVKYVHEVSTRGSQRAAELAPPLSLMGVRPLPEYERRIDHRGILSSLDDSAFQRGEAIYSRLCANCHGTHDRPGSLPTSLRFASGKFKRGADPYSMYLTLTHGYGQMIAQTWMAPTQKYDVIHYIREAYLKSRNPSQYVPLTDSYLASLPVGDTRGPKPVKFEPWATMNYGPTLTHTYEVGSDGSNFAYKGIAVRLDPGPGGISQGRRWMVFDEDTLRWAAGWSGEGFIDWNGIMFNGRHNIHPRIVGDVHFENPNGPGWAQPASSPPNLEDPRLQGRDDRHYGPLPREWAQFKGLYHFGQQAVVSYRVGNADVLEMPQATPHPEQADAVIFQRNMQVGPRQDDLLLRVARVPESLRGKRSVVRGDESSIIRFGGTVPEAAAAHPTPSTLNFDGSVFVELPGESFDMTAAAYTIHARIRTKKDGVIFAKTTSGPRWAHDCKALFVRGGKLTFDIGWVGDLRGKRRVSDGRWHDVTLAASPNGRITLYVDGQVDAEGRLAPKAKVDGHVVRFGFSSANFPANPAFVGDIERISFHPQRLTEPQIAQLLGEQPGKVAAPARRWSLQDAQEIVDQRGKSAGRVVGNDQPARNATRDASRAMAASVAGLPSEGDAWQVTKEGDLLLKLPAGSAPLTLRVSLTSSRTASDVDALAKPLGQLAPPLSLEPLTTGGPSPWGVVLPTTALLGDDSGPFATDILAHPEANPWMCRVRLTGFDFFPGGDEAAVCSWDGDVWRVKGLLDLEQGLTWRRIASGMFQPLGVKIVEDDIYVSCRDQIAILRDLNEDGETDFYECFNNDHQVTEHFHEFAMGLQRDEEGNFYYAKSARHALPALVPHHGTLLRVTPDGERTDILATGFRAANGVCLNPDGSFIVTDQEGHWNPKNRINYVKPGGFYGNMYGYHDVTDASDEAMEQPLCWITNSFDRSPAELLWVDSPQWGPLHGSLLNLSYGYGRIFVVPHEKIDGQAQGGMCQLPIPDTPTGLIRGRFHPVDGQLYACGMFAWAGSRQQPGGFYRVRYTGKPVHLPIGIHATQRGVRLTFSGGLNEAVAEDAKRYQVKIWSLKRTKNYGSKHYDERSLTVESANVVSKGRVVDLTIPQIEPTWCMEIKYSLEGANGEPIQGVIHNTIHTLKNE